MSQRSCAACSGPSLRRAKLISCLHFLCGTCLERHIQQDGSIRCPACATATPAPPPGRNHAQWLPDHPLKKTSGSPNCVLCDECVGERVAAGACVDCDVNLCDVHSKSHQYSRGTSHHRIKELLASRDLDVLPIDHDSHQKAAAQRCTLHPSEDLVKCCIKCCDVLCQLCIASGPQKHADHSDLIDTIDGGAVHKTRAAVCCKLEDAISQSNTKLDEARAAMQAVHDNTEDMSQHVAEYFESLIKSLKSREQALLDELDRERLAKLLPLEQRVDRLQTCVETGRTALEIARLVGNVDFLTTRKWFTAAAENSDNVAATSAASNRDTSRVFFFPTDSAFTESAGCLVSGKSARDLIRVEYPDQCRVNSDITVLVRLHLPNVDPHPTQQTWDYLDCSFTIQGPDGAEHRYRPSASAPGLSTVTFRPVRTGQHSISLALPVASKGGRRPTRPVYVPQVLLKVLPNPCYLFEPDGIQSGLELTNDGRTVRKLTDAAYRSARTVNIGYCTDQIKVRIDATRSGYVFLCACSSTVPGHSDAKTSFGWWGGQEKVGVCNGTQLGQPWTSGDVISLTLNPSKHTLKGERAACHSGSVGGTQELKNVVGSLYWYIALCDAGDQVTVLSCM